MMFSKYGSVFEIQEHPSRTDVIYVVSGYIAMTTRLRFFVDSCHGVANASSKIQSLFDQTINMKRIVENMTTVSALLDVFAQ